MPRLTAAQRNADLEAIKTQLYKNRGYSKARLRGIMKGIEVDKIINRSERPGYNAAKAVLAGRLLNAKKHSRTLSNLT